MTYNVFSGPGTLNPTESINLNDVCSSGASGSKGALGRRRTGPVFLTSSTTDRSTSVTCSCVMLFELHSHISGSVVVASCVCYISSTDFTNDNSRRLASLSTSYDTATSRGDLGLCGRTCHCR